MKLLATVFAALVLTACGGGSEGTFISIQGLNSKVDRTAEVPALPPGNVPVGQIPPGYKPDPRVPVIDPEVRAAAVEADRVAREAWIAAHPQEFAEEQARYKAWRAQMDVYAAEAAAEVARQRADAERQDSLARAKLCGDMRAKGQFQQSAEVCATLIKS